tara:strand:+ start:502 stop:915 length:414 start_codon:yes stop_codon:yes gene_type:complete
MNIYFAGSIRGGRKDRETYLKIIKYLSNYGNVLTEHIGDSKLDSMGENEMDDKKIHNRDMQWLIESDLLIAEVTNPSLGVGYEIGRAIENRKKILCLFRENHGQKLSAMIAGSADLKCIKYSSIEDLKKKLIIFFQS